MFSEVFLMTPAQRRSIEEFSEDNPDFLLQLTHKGSYTRVDSPFPGPPRFVRMLLNVMTQNHETIINQGARP